MPRIFDIAQELLPALRQALELSDCAASAPDADQPRVLENHNTFLIAP